METCEASEWTRAVHVGDEVQLGSRIMDKVEPDNDFVLGRSKRRLFLSDRGISLEPEALSTAYSL